MRTRLFLLGVLGAIGAIQYAHPTDNVLVGISVIGLALLTLGILFRGKNELPKINH